jgi:hypothetical protein
MAIRGWYMNKGCGSKRRRNGADKLFPCRRTLALAAALTYRLIIRPPIITPSNIPDQIPHPFTIPSA